MSVQLKEKAQRMEQFLLWLEVKKGASLIDCQKWLMHNFRMSTSLARTYIEELSFTDDIKFGKDRKFHSMNERPL